MSGLSGSDRTEANLTRKKKNRGKLMDVGPTEMRRIRSPRELADAFDKKAGKIRSESVSKENLSRLGRKSLLSSMTEPKQSSIDAAFRALSVKLSPSKPSKSAEASAQFHEGTARYLRRKGWKDKVKNRGKK